MLEAQLVNPVREIEVETDMAGAVYIFAVDSVNGKTGHVQLNASDVGAYSKEETDEAIKNQIKPWYLSYSENSDEYTNKMNIEAFNNNRFRLEYVKLKIGTEEYNLSSKVFTTSFVKLVFNNFSGLNAAKYELYFNTERGEAYAISYKKTNPINTVLSLNYPYEGMEEDEKAKLNEDNIAIIKALVDLTAIDAGNVKVYLGNPVVGGIQANSISISTSYVTFKFNDIQPYDSGVQYIITYYRDMNSISYMKEPIAVTQFNTESTAIPNMMAVAQHTNEVKNSIKKRFIFEETQSSKDKEICEALLHLKDNEYEVFLEKSSITSSNKSIMRLISMSSIYISEDKKFMSIRFEYFDGTDVKYYGIEYDTETKILTRNGNSLVSSSYDENTFQYSSKLYKGSDIAKYVKSKIDTALILDSEDLL